VRRANNLTTFTCRLSRNCQSINFLQALRACQGLSVMELLSLLSRMWTRVFFYFQIFPLITSTFLLHIIHRHTYNYTFANHVTYTASFILCAEYTFLAASKMLCSCGLRSDVCLTPYAGGLTPHSIVKLKI
jgi:hypothetical protein